MTKVQSYGFIKDGKLNILNKKRMADDLRQFKDCDVTVIVKRKGKASSQTRRYYFGIIVKEITLRLRELGNDVNEEVVHEWLKLKCNKTYLKDEEGTVIGEVGATTTDHNPEERSEFLEACIRLAAESLDLTISPPNTQVKMFQEEEIERLKKTL